MYIVFVLYAAVTLDPKNNTLYWQKASLLCEMKEHRKAIDTYEHLLKVFLSQTENVSETAPVISG